MKRFFLLLTMISLFGGVLSAQELPSDEAWRADIEALSRGILRLHPDPFRNISEDEFRASVDGLLQDVPTLSDDEILVRIMRIVAALGDGHNWIWSPRGFYPLIFYHFDDGIYAVDADEAYRDFIGARLVSVGGVDAQSAFDTLRLSATADNEWSALQTTARQLSARNILRGAGIISDEPEYVLELPNGDSVTHNPDPVNADDLTLGALLEEFPITGLPYREGLRYLDMRHEDFWFQYMEDSRVFYVVYNMMTDRTASGLTVSMLADELQRHIDEGLVERVIIDLRNNPGGNEATSRPLSEFLQNHDFFDDDGRLLILTSRHTFSAAVVFSLRLEGETAAVFLGEATGGKPLMFENNRPVQLPNSGITVRISTRARGDVGPADTRRSIAPDIPIPTLAVNYFSGGDPVFEAALNYAP